MFVLLLIIICIVYAWFLRRIKMKSPKLPSYPGALPLIGHAHLLAGDNTRFWETLRNISMESLKYGGALNFSIGPLIQTILADPDDCGIVMNLSMQKHYLYSFGKDWLGEGLITASATVWNSHRKLLCPMFSQQVLNGFMDIFNKQAKRFVSQLAAEEGKGPFNHERYLSIMGLETICQTALGTDVWDYDSSKEEYLNAISEVLKGLNKRFSMVWLHNDYVFNWSSLKKKQDMHLELIHNISNRVYQNRKALFKQKSVDDTGEFKPFIDHILKISKEKGVFTEKEIKDELNTIIMAGYETTVGTLVYALMLLGSHQDVQDRLYEEIQEVCEKSERDVEKQDLPKLVYMEAVLREALRLYPVEPILSRHNDREIKLKNCTLPAGSDCIISVYALHRHPVWGPDAEEFKPERWLDPTSMPDIRNAFGAFGLGKRACSGKAYGLMAIKTTLVHVLRRYRISADITKLVLKMDVLLKPASGQHIMIEPRTK